MIGVAAYISGQKLYDHYYGRFCNYSQRKDVLYTTILLPHNAPIQFYERELLWSAVDEAEKRKDARTARVVIMALPTELSLEQQIELSKNFIQETFVSQGMGADIAIHDKGDGNPHMHALLTTRVIGSEGLSKKKIEPGTKK